MSDLLNSASLVMIPSGYKEDIVYSQIPTNGSGDLSFTRASNGTRINSAGLVEVCPWNLLQQSNTFNASPWSMNVTSGQAGKDGQNNAWLLTKLTATTSDYYLNNVYNGDQTFTIYVKKESSKGFKLYPIGTTTENVEVNLQTGVVYLATAGITSTTVEAYSSTWWKISVALNMINSNYYIYVTNGAGTQIASSITIQDAQVNIGLTAKPYFPTTDRLNVPRLTYQNGGGGCPSLLLEKQSTNLQYYSQQFDLWSNASDLTVSANATTSPDGTQNADKLNENSSNGYHIIGDSNFNSTAGTTYTMSFFAKASERSYARILAPASSYNTDYAYFDLTNGSVSVSSGTASMQSMGNGWYRCVWSLAAVSTSGGIGMWIGPARNMTDAYNTYTGTSGSGIFVYGAQLEASSYPTSYIPTTSASATRVADGPLNLSTTQTLTNFTLFYDGLIFENGQNMLFGSGNSAWYIDIDGSNGRVVLDLASGRIYGAFSSLTTNQRYKLAVKRSAGVVDAFVNGTKLTPSFQVTDTTSLTLSSITWGFSSTYYPKMKVNEICAFQVALSDSDCQALTTI